MTHAMTAAETKKLWGENRHVYAGDGYSVHHARINKGGFSSRHKHEHKHNLFYVISGELLVRFYTGPDDLVGSVVALNAGDRIVAEAGEWHGFEAMTDVELVEIYFVHAAEADIVRADVGGTRKAA